MVKRDRDIEAEENIFLPLADAADEAGEFNESAYLERRPDVAEAITSGAIPSGLFHYRIYGQQEEQIAEPASNVAPAEDHRNRTEAVHIPHNMAQHSACHVDTVIFSKTAGIFIVGWADETLSEVARLRVRNGADECVIENWKLIRFRRRDVESALAFEGTRNFGFCALSGENSAPGHAARSTVCQISIEFENGAKASFETEARFVDDMSMLETALSYFGGLDFFGNKAVESLFALDGFLGNEFVLRSRKLSQSITAAVSCERFGPKLSRPRGSIIVCLYGRPEYLFLQNAAFFSSPEASQYEFIYVCNSPELIEELCKTASASSRIYGHSQCIVALPGNAGFGGANNAATEFAQSDRLMFVNPDVLPVNNAWATTHGEILDQDRNGNTDLFGAPLYYADGSLMHSGMYFEIDQGISVSGMEIRHRPMLRVEHFAKGAPHTLDAFTRSRPVPAVSGAFISIKRSLFETLEGFSNNYVFGHYEDADLCLRAMQKGVTPWIHNLPLWHLEGKGSRRLPHHDGATTVNRWQFGQMWHDVIVQGLTGKTPAVLADVSREASLHREAHIENTEAAPENTGAESGPLFAAAKRPSGKRRERLNKEEARSAEDGANS